MPSGSALLLVASLVLAVVMCVSFHARNRDNGGFVSSGEVRTYRLYVPTSYDPRPAHAARDQHARQGAPDRTAAVGLGASAQFLPWSACQGQRAVPMISFRGTEDRFTPFHGGRFWVARDHVFPSSPGLTATWARGNRCAASPAESRVAADVTRLEYTGRAGDADVVLYTIHGGGQTWPGGGPMMLKWFARPTSRDVDATRQT